MTMFNRESRKALMIRELNRNGVRISRDKLERLTENELAAMLRECYRTNGAGLGTSDWGGTFLILGPLVLLGLIGWVFSNAPMHPEERNR